MVDRNYYGGGRKLNARGWSWNRLGERCERPEKAVGMALLGPDPRRDLVKAVNAGFRWENVIGVDTAEESVAAARSLGANAIRGTLQEVLANWTGEPLDFLLVDSKSSFSILYDLVSITGNRQVLKPWAPVYVNMLRGREKGVGKEFLEEAQFWSQDTNHTDRENRGHMALGILSRYGMYQRWDLFRELGINGGCAELIRRMAPAFHSYRSEQARSRCVMDSICCRWPLWPPDAAVGGQALPINKPVRQRIAALKAVRTKAGRKS